MTKTDSTVKYFSTARMCFLNKVSTGVRSYRKRRALQARERVCQRAGSKGDIDFKHVKSLPCAPHLLWYRIGLFGRSLSTSLRFLYLASPREFANTRLRSIYDRVQYIRLRLGYRSSIVSWLFFAENLLLLVCFLSLEFVVTCKKRWRVWRCWMCQVTK